MSGQLDLRARVQAKLAEVRAQRATVTPAPAPRYDEVYFEGAAMLDAMARGEEPGMTNDEECELFNKLHHCKYLFEDKYNEHKMQVVQAQRAEALELISSNLPEVIDLIGEALRTRPVLRSAMVYYFVNDSALLEHHELRNRARNEFSWACQCTKIYEHIHRIGTKICVLWSKQREVGEARTIVDKELGELQKSIHDVLSAPKVEALPHE